MASSVIRSVVVWVTQPLTYQRCQLLKIRICLVHMETDYTFTYILLLFNEGSRGLTASGCARPRCHVIAICMQDWLTSGRLAMIISMVTASLSAGGGCLMVQGVLGTQAHQSNWKHITHRERVMCRM